MEATTVSTGNILVVMLQRKRYSALSNDGKAGD
jgi:hypothetical protein